MAQVLLILTALSLILLAPEKSHGGEKLLICGTGDSQTLLRSLADDFEKVHTGTEVDVPESIGSSGGIRATAAGKCDLGRVARKIKEKEEHFGLTYTPFALSPIVFVVNPSVRGVEQLSSEDIVRIYNGDLALWSQLGGPKREKIYAISREPGDSSNSVLNKKLKGFADSDMTATKLAYSTPEVVSLVTSHGFTIGYGPLSMFSNTELKIISLNGIEPNEDSFRAGTYDLLTEFAIVHKGKLQGPALQFMKYLNTKRAHNIMKNNNVLPWISTEQQ